MPLITGLPPRFPGTVSISGSLGLGAGLPLSLKIEAHNARPLASDLITANLDMDLTIVGPLRQKLDASGKLHINRADLNIPNALPPTVAVLDVRRPGQQSRQRQGPERDRLGVQARPR